MSAFTSFPDTKHIFDMIAGYEKVIPVHWKVSINDI